MNKWKYYFKSFRLRTLPLSLSGVIAGAMIAASCSFAYSEFWYNSRQNSATATRLEQGINPQTDSIIQQLTPEYSIYVKYELNGAIAESVFLSSDTSSSYIWDHLNLGDAVPLYYSVRITPLEEGVSPLEGTGFSFLVKTSSKRGDRTFNVGVFIFAILTTLCLQILSNLSNDYGDMMWGTDNEDRLGPQRSLQMGELSMEDMRRGIIVFALLSALFGVILVRIALGSNYPWGTFFMRFIGALAIIGAVKYTVGKGAYGYYGLGDLGVLIFFGLVSTVCTYYLMCNGVFWEAYVLLPAFSIGLFSVGVLNLNNMRDIENDAKFGKRTLPVRFGEEWAKKYHKVLIYVGLLCAFVFAILCRNHGWSFLFLLTLPFFLVHLRRVRNASGAELDSELRYLSLTTFAFAFLIGLGQLL